MEYFTMTTNAGDESIANAIKTGTKTTFKQIAVGDGNGAYYEPAKTQTALRREVWRGDAVVTIDPKNAKRVIVTATIPATIGGFTVREAGIFDTANTLMVISKLPLSEKVAPESGASSDLVIRLYVEVSDANSVSITVDPSAVLATQMYVNEAFEPIQKQVTDHIVDTANPHKTTAAQLGSFPVYNGTATDFNSALIPGIYGYDPNTQNGFSSQGFGQVYVSTLDGKPFTNSGVITQRAIDNYNMPIHRSKINEGAWNPWVRDCDGGHASTADNALKVGGVSPELLVRTISGGSQIQSGSGTITVQTANITEHSTITFPRAFTSAPQVFACLSGLSVYGDAYAFVTAAAITGTEFSISVGSGRSGTPVSFSWLALGLLS